MNNAEVSGLCWHVRYTLRDVSFRSLHSVVFEGAVLKKRQFADDRDMLR